MAVYLQSKAGIQFYNSCSGLKATELDLQLYSVQAENISEWKRKKLIIRVPHI